MNILREVRRINRRSVPARIVLILLFSVVLITTTYAWYRAEQGVDLSGLEGAVTSWDVAYYVNNETNEILDQTVTLAVDEFYPGMPEREDKVHIYNMGTSSTKIEYELLSIKVFGTEVLPQLQANNEIVTDEDTNTTTLFSKDTNYPFKIVYTYDKDYLRNKYVDEATTPQAHATFRFLVNWDYDVENGTDAQNAVKDALDTKFGKDAYEYYNDNTKDPTKAVQIQVRITSSFIHPKTENLP